MRALGDTVTTELQSLREEVGIVLKNCDVELKAKCDSVEQKGNKP